MNLERDTFRPYLERRYQQAKAITYGAKLTVIDTLIEEVKQGRIPISPDQAVKLNPNSPSVRAVREGRAVSLDGKEIAGISRPNVKRRNAIFALLLFSLIPLFGVLWWVVSRAEANEGEATAALVATEIATVTLVPTVSLAATLPLPLITIQPTLTPEPTFTPVPIDETEFTVDIEYEPNLNNSPIALSFAGRNYRVTTADLETIWTPTGVEWWPETHIRRVFAVPYQDTILAEAFAHVGQTITVRLRTGVSIAYRLDDIRQVNALQIEHLTAIAPSIAIILYDGEPNDSQERWLLTGMAQQEVEEGMLVTSLENAGIFAPLDFLTILHCQPPTTTATTMVCTVELNAGKDPQHLILTDQAWLPAIEQIPPTNILHVSDPVSDTITIQLSGVVSQGGTPVIAYQEGNQPNPVGAVIPTHLIGDIP